MEETENIKYEQKRRISEYIGAIVANAVLLFVLNSLYGWKVPFLTESYKNCLWAIDISLISAIAANFVFIFFDRHWFKYFMQIFTSSASFLALYVIHSVFPFEFTSHAWYLGLKVFLIVAMVMTGVSVIYNIIRTIIPYKSGN